MQNTMIDLVPMLIICAVGLGAGVLGGVIGFGTTLSPFLTDCAGPGHYFEAGNAAQLNDVFGKIATQLGDLRVTK